MILRDVPHQTLNESRQLLFLSSFAIIRFRSITTVITPRSSKPTQRDRPYRLDNGEHSWLKNSITISLATIMIIQLEPLVLLYQL